MDITLGSDPELFLTDRSGSLYPAGNLLPDGKEFGPDCGPRLVRDGVLLELRPEPARCIDQAVINTRQAITDAYRLAFEHELRLNPTARMPITEATLSHCTPDALRFGCDPDWSAYTGRKQAVRVDASRHHWRYSGGHIHIGTKALQTPEDYLSLCRVFDIFVGLPTTMMDRSPESAKRRKLYGRAGSFRPQPHGFEYRVPSNFWLSSPVLARAVFELSTFAYRVWESGEGEHVLQVLRESEGAIREAIDTSDADRSKQMLAAACIQLRSLEFPLNWWDMAVYLMKCEELPFAPLRAEWSLFSSESAFDGGRTRLRTWKENLALSGVSSASVEAYANNPSVDRALVSVSI